jgi:hypothetical protein
MVFQRQDERYSARAWGQAKDPYTAAVQFLEHYHGMEVRQTFCGHCALLQRHLVFSPLYNTFSTQRST